MAVLCLLVCAAGCGRVADNPTPSPSQAHQEMVRILKEENGLEPVTRAFDHTLWIYLPVENELLQLKAGQKGAQSSAESVVKPAVNFLDGSFGDGSFQITYDIAPEKSYPKSYGYDSTFSEQYQQDQRNILSAVYRAFGHFQESAAGGAALEGAPDFFVIVIADIVNGLESRTIFYLTDLRRAYTDPTFYEEYMRRIISEQPTGGQEIIGDKQGQHVGFKDLTWGEFLIKQMVYRITFKYQQSAFPPSDDARREILTAAADTVAAYRFTDFRSLKLHDLGEGKANEISRNDLAAYQSESSTSAEPSGGRLIHIKFQ